MNNYISKLSDKNIKKILDLRDMCLDIRQRDFFYKKVVNMDKEQKATNTQTMNEKDLIEALENEIDF